MQFEPVDVPGRGDKAGGIYTATESLYLDSKGNVVGHNNPDKEIKLVSKGASIAMEDAIRYGLLKASVQSLPDSRQPVVIPEIDDEEGEEVKPNPPIFDIPSVSSQPLKPPEVAAATKGWGYETPKRGRRRKMPK